MYKRYQIHYYGATDVRQKVWPRLLEFREPRLVISFYADLACRTQVSKDEWDSLTAEYQEYVLETCLPAERQLIENFLDWKHGDGAPHEATVILHIYSEDKAA